MATSYNIRNRLAQSSDTSRGVRKAPASGGVIKVSPVDLAVCEIDTTGARTLQSAASLGVGTRIICLATVAGVSVNSVDIGNGEFAEFVVVKNSSGDHQWQVSSATSIEDRLDAIQAGTTTGTGDISTYDEATFKAVLQALDAAGIITDNTTT